MRSQKTGKMEEHARQLQHFQAYEIQMSRLLGGWLPGIARWEVKHRVAALFRVAAQSLARSHAALGDYYRRMRSKLGPAGANTATAHKLARIYFHLVTTKEAYDESVFAKQEEREAKRRVERLKREATALGFVLSPAVAAA